MKKILLLFTIFSVFSFSNECSGNKCMIENKVVENENRIVNDLDYNKLKNKYIVYGSIYCHVCVSEFKHMQEIKNKYKDMANIVSVIYPNEAKEKIEEYFKKNGYNYDVYYDNNGDMANYMGIKYVPMIYKYDGEKNNIVELDDEYFTTKTFYNHEKLNIDKAVREKLQDIKVKDDKEKEYRLLDIVSSNTLIIYGAPWCSDCVKEYERLKKIKGKRKLIYLIQPTKYTYEEYLNYSKGKPNVYYILNDEIKSRFNLKWIPSVLEVKDNLFTNGFIGNDEFKVK